MKSAVETLGPTRARVTVEVPFEELKPSLDAAYKKIARSINVPGFRKGKVPPLLIDRQVGRGPVLDEAINEALPKLYAEALQANDVRPLARPDIDITRLEDNEVLEFTAEVDVRPQIALPDFTGLEVSVGDAAVTDAEVEEEVQELRERFATLVDVDRVAGDGDFVGIDLRATRGGEPVDGAEVSGMSYQVGSGGMIDGLDEALRGMGAGEAKTFSSTLVGGDQRGAVVDVEVRVTAVKEQELPELDDDFAQTASEFDTVAELTEDIRSRLEGGKRMQQAAEARDAVLEKLLGLVEVPLPKAVLEAELTSRREALEQRIGLTGASMQDYLDAEEQTIDEFEADLSERVRNAVAAQLLLDQVAEKEGISVDQAELSQHILRRAQQSGEDPNELAEHLVEHNHIPEMLAEVLRAKALSKIVEAARITDEAGRRIDLGLPQPDRTTGQEVPEAAEPGADAGSADEPGADAGSPDDPQSADRVDSGQTGER